MTDMFIVDEIRLLSANYSIKEPEQTKSDEQEDEASVKMKLAYSSRYIKENFNLRVSLEAICDAPGLPFELSVEMGGAFLFKTMPDEEKLEKLAHINCAAIIFPYLREMVSEMTMRGGHAPLYLPIINFVEHYKKFKAAQETEQFE